MLILVLTLFTISVLISLYLHGKTLAELSLTLEAILLATVSALEEACEECDKQEECEEDDRKRVV